MAEKIWERFPGLKVLVLGDFMLDRYLHGQVSRISPEAPVPVLMEDRSYDQPGGAANVAGNLAALGAEVHVLGVVGADREGEVLRKLLKRQGVRIEGLQVLPRWQTILKTRIIAGSQHVVRVDREAPVPPDARIQHKVLEYLQSADPPQAVIFQDYNKGFLNRELIGKVLGWCREHKVFTAVDPKFENFFHFHGVDLFKPNAKEAREALGTTLDAPDDLEQLGAALHARLKFRQMVITQGARGMTIFRGAEPGKHIPTSAGQVVDVSGAGDTVIASLVLALLAGADLEYAARFANTCAGLVCRELGAVPVNLDLIREVWDG